jgi:hypothetical protein
MIIKYYLNKINKKLGNYYNSYYKLYKLKKLRIKLKQINDINNVIYILKELNFNNVNGVTNSDNLLNTIYACYLIEAPSDNELQKISELQQLYNNKFNMEEYAITTLWCSIIYYIDNLPKIKRQKTWP